jgi:hypothetical protein
MPFSFAALQCNEVHCRLVGVGAMMQRCNGPYRRALFHTALLFRLFEVRSGSCCGGVEASQIARHGPSLSQAPLNINVYFRS